MASSANVALAPAPSARRPNLSTPRSRVGGKTVALTLSIAVHLGVALLAARHIRTAVASPEPTSELLELTTDLEPPTNALEPPAETYEASPPTRQPPPAAFPVAVQAALTRSAAPIVTAKVTRTEAAVSKSEPEPTPTTSPTSESPGPRFAITVTKPASSTSANPATASGTGTNAAALGGPTNAPFSSASVDVPARLRAGNVPAYTAAALAAGIEANVPLEIVISEAGQVTSARGLEHVGYGLDEAARQSVLGYRFTPALRNNRPVPVRMRWLMRFQLR